jgi:hypothetical protein
MAIAIGAWKPEKNFNPMSAPTASNWKRKDKFMKPSSPTNPDARQPLVEYHYYAPALSGSAARWVRTSGSLREISRDYFDREANRHFLSEAAMFLALIATPLVPIVGGASAVFELWRSLPLF